MIANSFVDRLNQLMLRLYDRQWTEWEILTIAITALFVLLWIISRLRKRAIRSVYENRFMESSPVIGMNLGAHKRSHRVIEDLKKGRFAAGQKTRQKPTKHAESSDKLREQIKQLQYEILKRKQNEVRFVERLANLTAANEKLQRELSEKKQAEKKTAKIPAADEQLKSVVHDTKQVEQKPELQVAQEPATGDKQQPEIPENEQAGQDIEEQTAGVPGDGRPAGKGKDEGFHWIADDVKQKLCRRCKEWKPESEFHKNASCKDGLAGSCKTCKAEAAREYRKRRKDAKG